MSNRPLILLLACCLLAGCGSTCPLGNTVCSVPAGSTAGGGGTDSNPTAFAFTDRTGVALGIPVTSDVVTLSGFNGPMLASCVGCTGITVNGVAGANTATVNPGDTIALTVKSAAFALTPVSVTITIGAAATAPWAVVGLWSVTTTADACASATLIAGTVCADNTVYAGLSPDGNVQMFVTRCDSGQSWNGSACIGTLATPQWCLGNSIGTSINSQITGKANTAALFADNFNGDAPYYAANFCVGLTTSGHTDWYLPAPNELSIIYINSTAIGGFNTGLSYWTSAEASSFQATVVNMGNGGRSNPNKTSSAPVRCARHN